MKLEHAIKTLEKELERLNTPLEDEEEDDLVGGVLHFRQTTDIKTRQHCIFFQG